MLHSDVARAALRGTNTLTHITMVNTLHMLTNDRYIESIAFSRKCGVHGNTNKESVTDAMNPMYVRGTILVGGGGGGCSFPGLGGECLPG